MISSKTSFIALIGNPVSHSLSPIMQNAAFQYLGLDLIYLAIPCKDEDLELVLNSLKSNDLFGNHTPSLSNNNDPDDRLWRITDMKIYPWGRL